MRFIGLIVLAASAAAAATITPRATRPKANEYKSGDWYVFQLFVTEWYTYIPTMAIREQLINHTSFFL
jgi:hypothetical protein